MPDVPFDPGVPALSSYAVTGGVLLTEDLLSAAFGRALNVWGVFFNGIPVLSYDSFARFGYRQDWKILSYPVEGGAFQNYDKVQLPAEIVIRLNTGGSTVARQAMLFTIDLQMSTIATYDIVTPEFIYTGYNFVSRSYDKEAESAGMVSIDLHFGQILQTATAQLQNVASAAFAGQNSSGITNANPVSPTLGSVT